MLQDELNQDDWSLIAAALGHFGGPTSQTDDESNRFYGLADIIAQVLGLPSSELVR